MSTEESLDSDQPASERSTGEVSPANLSESKNAMAIAPSTDVIEDAAPSEQPRSVAKTTICGVCKERASKYKCTRCFLPYCSVACSTIHKSTHPAIDTTPTPTPETKLAPSTDTVQPKALAGTKGFQDPFAALQESDKLQKLFKMYPLLPSQLDEIHAATLQPLQEDGFTHYGSRGGGRGGRGGQGGGKQPWNRDRGIQNGLEALSRARCACGEDGEGVREFSKLVLQILSGDEGPSAVEMVERERAEEDMRIITQLLNHESR